QFGKEAKQDHSRQPFGAAQIQNGGQDEQGKRDRGRRHAAVRRRRAEQVRNKWRRPNRNRGDRHAERPQVSPSGQPAPAFANQSLGPRQNSAGDRILRDDLAEYQANQRLTDADDKIAPEKRRTAGGEQKRKQRVTPDAGTKMGNAGGKFPQQAHRPLDAWPRPKLVQFFVVVSGWWVPHPLHHDSDRRGSPPPAIARQPPVTPARWRSC